MELPFRTREVRVILFGNIFGGAYAIDKGRHCCYINTVWLDGRVG